MKLHEIAELQENSHDIVYFKLNGWPEFAYFSAKHVMTWEDGSGEVPVRMNDLLRVDFIIKKIKIEPEIKPCPFCGINVNEIKNVNNVIYALSCLRCIYTIFIQDEIEQKFIERWNRRV